VPATIWHSMTRWKVAFLPTMLAFEQYCQLYQTTTRGTVVFGGVIRQSAWCLRCPTLWCEGCWIRPQQFESDCNATSTQLLRGFIQTRQTASTCWWQLTLGTYKAKCLLWCVREPNVELCNQGKGRKFVKLATHCHGRECGFMCGICRVVWRCKDGAPCATMWHHIIS
jgi:hypothetical protein